VRGFLAIAVLGVSGAASAATVTIDRPTQSETTSSNNVMVSVSVSDDFVIGQDGWVELWVDGNFATWLKENTGVVTLQPGNHTIQARLVTIYHQPLRVPAVSDRVLVTVPSVDPSGGD
jgi:hypothetical protein